MRFHNTNPDIKSRIVAINNSIKAIVLSPSESVHNATAILWIHGGGYISGMKEMVYSSQVEALVSEYKAVVISPDYRLAWFHPYPAALNDCYTSLLYVKEHAAELGIRDDQIMVGGESAGGGLAAALCLYSRDRKEINIAYQMPLYPMIDNLDTSSSKDNHGKVWNSRRNRFAWRIYLRNLARSAEVPSYAAPARADDYSHLPPAYTFAAIGEPFFQETADYIKALRQAGTNAEMDVYEGDMHAFDMLMPEDEVSQLAAKRFREHFAYAQNNYFAPQEPAK